MDKIRILLADDHPVFLHGLKDIIQEEPAFEVAGSATNGADLVEMVKREVVDLVILDVDMPILNGLKASETILEINPSVEIIILTMYKDKFTLLKALEIGVAGYVLKENAVVDIIQAIRSVREGNSYLSPEMTRFLLGKKRKKEKNGDISNLLSILSPAEKRVLQLVAQYKTSREIANELFISEKTVSNHRMNITKKLELTGKNSLLRFAVENKIEEFDQ